MTAEEFRAVCRRMGDRIEAMLGEAPLDIVDERQYRTLFVGTDLPVEEVVELNERAAGLAFGFVLAGVDPVVAISGLMLQQQMLGVELGREIERALAAGGAS